MSPYILNPDLNFNKLRLKIVDSPLYGLANYGFIYGIKLEGKILLKEIKEYFLENFGEELRPRFLNNYICIDEHTIYFKREIDRTLFIMRFQDATHC